MITLKVAAGVAAFVILALALGWAVGVFVSVLDEMMER